MNGMNGDSRRSAPSKMLTTLANAARACSRSADSQPGLHQFDIPVAEFAPEEVIDHVRGLVEAVRLQRVVDLPSHTVEARQNPAVFKALHRESGQTVSAKVRRPNA